MSNSYTSSLAQTLAPDVLERFLRYVRIDTQSRRDRTSSPSTPGQLELGRLLVAELQEAGLGDAALDENGYVIATLPASNGAGGEAIGLIAHMDTSSDAPGRGVARRDLEAGYMAELVLNATMTLPGPDGKDLGTIEGRFAMERSPGGKATDLDDAALKGVKLEPDEENTRLLYDSVSQGVRFEYGRALGIHPLVLGLAEDRIRAAVGADDPGELGVVLVGRGSSDPDANADLYKVGRLLQDSRGLGLVEPAFISLAPPSVPEALERCRRLGATTIAVVPYFLFTGVLVDRIHDQADAWAADHPDVEVRHGAHLGSDARLAQLVLERHQEAIEGEARMNCDCCVYRIAIPG